MWCIARPMASWGVCVSVIFSPSGSHTILVFPYQTGWRYSNGNPANGASNAGGVGRNRDSEPICLQQARFVNMVAGGRRPPYRKLWQLYRRSYTAGIRSPSATRDKVTVSVVLQRERPSALALYTITIDRVFDSKALCYAEDNTTESNCMH